MLALPGETETIGVRAKRLERTRNGRSRRGVQLLNSFRRDDVLARAARQRVDGCEQRVFVRRFGIQRRLRAALQIVKTRGQANLIAEFQVTILEGTHVGAGQFRHPPQHGVVEGRITLDLQIREYLIEPVRGDGSQSRGLAKLGPEDFRETRSQRIERRISAGVSEWQHRQ